MKEKQDSSVWTHHILCLFITALLRIFADTCSLEDLFPILLGVYLGGRLLRLSSMFNQI